MRPLRNEIGSPDAETAREARLIRAMSPLQPSLARMQRVRMALEARPTRWWHALGAHPVLAAAGGAALALLVMAQVQLRSTVAAVAGADSQEARRAAHRRAEAARVDLAGTAPRVAPTPVADGTPAIVAPGWPELPAVAPVLPMLPGAGGADVAPPVIAPSLVAQVPAAETQAVTPQVAPPLPLVPQLPLLNPLPFTNEAVPPGGVLAVTPPEAAPRESTAGVAVDPAAAGGGGSTFAANPGFGTAVVPVLPAPAPGTTPGAGSVGGGSGPVNPPGPDGDRPAPAPGGGRHRGNWEAAVVASRDSGPDRDGATVALAFNGSLDGRPVTGTVLWRRGDDKIHALVLRRDDADVVQSTAVQAPIPLDAADTGFDLDDDGQDDVLLSLDPQGGEQQDCTATTGTMPGVTVLLRANP